MTMDITTWLTESRILLAEWERANDRCDQIIPWLIGSLVVGLGGSFGLNLSTHSLWGLLFYLPFCAAITIMVERLITATKFKRRYKRLEKARDAP